MEWTFTLDNIRVVARDLLKGITNKKIIAIHGMMGSGKTTFIHALCDEMRVKDVVGSPTFSIINEYESSAGKIYHIDLFRLKDADEAIQAGVEECLYSNEICLVEWPERAPSLFPEHTVQVYIHAIDEETRHIQIDDN